MVWIVRSDTLCFCFHLLETICKFGRIPLRMSHQGREFGGLPASQKSLNSLLLLDITLTKKFPCPLITAHTEKKVSLVAFRQFFSKILPQACIFSNTIMTYLKNLVGTKSLNTKQFPAALSPRIIPHYPLSPKHLWKTLGMGKNPTQQPKIYLFPTSQKFLLIN